MGDAEDAAMSEERSSDDAAKDVLRRAISRVEHLLHRLEFPGPPIAVPAITEAGPQHVTPAAGGEPPSQATSAAQAVRTPPPMAGGPARDVAPTRSEIESLRAEAIADASLLLVDAQVIAASVLTQACGLAERTLDGAESSRLRAGELLSGAGAAAEDARDAVDELVAALVAVRERLTERVGELTERIIAVSAVAGADR
jgi:hypothetical protein